MWNKPPKHSWQRRSHARAEMHIWTPPFKEMALSRHMIKNECCVTVWCVCMCVWTPYTKRILRRPAGHISRNCKIQIILYKDKPSKGGWVESTKKRKKKNSKYACYCTTECISVCVYIWHKFTCVCVLVCVYVWDIQLQFYIELPECQATQNSRTAYGI